MSFRIVPVATRHDVDRLSLVLRAGLAIKATPDGSPSEGRRVRQRSDGTPLEPSGQDPPPGFAPPSPVLNEEEEAWAREWEQAEAALEFEQVMAREAAEAQAQGNLREAIAAAAAQAAQEAEQAAAQAQQAAQAMLAAQAAVEKVPMGTVLPIKMPTASENPGFRSALMGTSVLHRMVVLMLNDKRIVGSYSGSVVLSGNRMASYRGWVSAGQELALKTRLGKGRSNFSYLVPVGEVPIRMADSLPGVTLPRMVYRRTRGDAAKEIVPKAEEAIKELVITGYASLTGLGPKLYGAYLVNKSLPKVVEPGAFVNLHVLAEAWDGDLETKLKNREFDRVRFAQQLSMLLAKSRVNGFWHMDAKPPNMLYRGTDQQFTICWTDFDSTWCKVWPPNLRQGQGNCSVLVHAAMIMGYISCWHGRDVYNYYLPAVQAQLVQDFGLDAGTDDAMCSWLDSLETQEGEPTPPVLAGSNPAEHLARLRIANTLRHTMHHYLQPVPPRNPSANRCILVANLQRPTFFQFFKFALAQETTEIRSWSRLAQRVSY